MKCLIERGNVSLIFNAEMLLLRKLVKLFPDVKRPFDKAQCDEHATVPIQMCGRDVKIDLPTPFTIEQFREAFERVVIEEAMR